MPKLWVCDDEPSSRFPVFTRGNVGEVFNVAVSPLTWTTFGLEVLDGGWREAFCDIGLFTPDEFKPPGQAEILACFGGYLYINMSITRVLAVRIPGLTVEAIDRSLFGDYTDVPPYRPDPRDQNPERTAAVSAWLASLFTVDPRPAAAADRQRAERLAASAPYLGSMSDADLLRYYRSLLTEIRPVFKHHVMNTYGANVLTSLIAQTCQGAGVPELAPRITAAIGDVDSAQQSFELWELSRFVQGAPRVAAAFDLGIDGLLQRLAASDDLGARDFLERWNGFIGRWGFLGLCIWEFRSPTYRSDPSIPLRMLDRARRAPDTSAPAARAAAMVAERGAAIREMAERLSGAPEARQQFLAATASDPSYLGARERSKVSCNIIVDVARAPLRELGTRLVNRGLLDRWEDVLMLMRDEVETFLARPEGYRERIRERAAQLALLESKEPPFVFEGEPPPITAYKDRNAERIEPAPAGSRLSGIGVSPGRYTGRAHVVESLTADSELEPGEIIVAPITDAAWGPLFLAAGAVVVETGAAISHAAIVSRELGIPAVASVTGATQLIRNGAMITVDGSTGTVDVH